MVSKSHNCHNDSFGHTCIQYTLYMTIPRSVSFMGHGLGFDLSLHSTLIYVSDLKL